MKRVFALGLPLSLLTIALSSWAQKSIAQTVPIQIAPAKVLDAKPALPKLTLRSISTQSAHSTKQLAQATEPIGQRIRYTGPFTNTSVNLSGDVVIELVLEENNRISGYINFTNYPDVPSLCGAGDFTGYRQGHNLQFSFVSNDPEPDCGFDRGWFFTVTATLSEDYQTIENGAYQIDDRRGVFRAVAENIPVAQTLSTASSTASTASVILDTQGTIDRNSQVLESDGSRYNEYRFQGQAGQEVTITMQSRELDTYLILLDPNGNSIAQNDDVSSSNTNSEITITLPQTGTYIILTNTYNNRDRGNYSLTVQGLPGETESPVATTPPERSQSVTQPSSTSPTPSPAPLSPMVGTVECAGNNSDDTTYSNRRNMTSATLEPAGQGYTLRIVEDFGENVFTLDQNLTIVSAATVEEQRLLPWNLVAYDGTPIMVSRNGSFNISMRVSTRSGCTFQGQLTFQNGADVALFGTSEMNERNDATSTITQTNSTTPLERSQSAPQPSSPSPSAYPSITPSSEEVRPGFERYVVPGMYSIEIPIGWVVWTPGSNIATLVFANENPTTNSDRFGDFSSLIKTDVYIIDESFDTEVSRSLSRRGERHTRYTVTRQGSLTVGGRDAFRIWSESPDEAIIIVSTIIRHSNNRTIKISSFFWRENSNAIETVQDIHWSFRVIE